MTSTPVLLLITNSYDTTADLLVSRVGPQAVFRFNFDIWPDYGFELTADGPAFRDPSGRTIKAPEIAKVLWRKPRSRTGYRPASQTDEDRYYDQEVWYALRDLVNLLWLDGKVVLAEPFAELRAGKFVQMRVASRYFQVPPYQFRRAMPSRFAFGTLTVAKSLTMEPVGEEAQRELLFTTRVDDADLSPECPWMVQQLIDAQKDVTVAFVRDRLFAFELDRTQFREKHVDWRELPSESRPLGWEKHSLPKETVMAIHAFMAEMGLQFGRFDFLLGPEGYFFLEVNSNGEWAWLDADGRHGLLPKVVEEISPLTALHPLPMPRGVITGLPKRMLDLAAAACEVRSNREPSGESAAAA
ncbi:MAG: hypothetical protein ABSC72_13225 [Methylovirgula sp.]